MSAVSDTLAKVKSVATSVVAAGAVVVAVLTAVATSVVPVLPVALGAKVALWVASALGVTNAIVSVVKRVTEVPEDLVGLKPVSAEDKAISFANQASWDPEDPFWGDAA